MDVATRQSGQVRKEAATTGRARVACQPPTFHRPSRRSRCINRPAREGRKIPRKIGVGGARMDGLFPTDATDGAAASSAKPAVYRVLARKYRPQSFDDLIGQEPMVRTLSNAFEIGRIAQGYMLTGVRGVGKTTTARILARALNYEIPGEINRPTIRMPTLGVHCQAIMEGRHVDVIEMDAASHTSIGDIREIIEAVRYKPVSARTKVYIIDEVHMLSTWRARARTTRHNRTCPPCPCAHNTARPHLQRCNRGVDGPGAGDDGPPAAGGGGTCCLRTSCRAS